MEEKIDIKAKTIKVDTGKGNTIKVTMSYGCKFRFIGSPIPLATDQCFRL